MNAAEEQNPYRSPRATTEPNKTTTEPTRRRTRWRIAPVTLFLIFGTFGLLATPFMMIAEYNQPPEFGGGIAGWRILVAALVGIQSLLLIASGILCWRGRWWWTCLAFALAVLVGFVSNELLADLQL